MNKAERIDRKHELIARIARLRRQLQRPEMQKPRNQRQRQRLQQQLDALMAEEYRLRLQIDRSR
jgi:hypothetical protein